MTKIRFYEDRELLEVWNLEGRMTSKKWKEIVTGVGALFLVNDQMSTMTIEICPGEGSDPHILKAVSLDKRSHDYMSVHPLDRVYIMDSHLETIIRTIGF